MNCRRRKARHLGGTYFDHKGPLSKNERRGRSSLGEQAVGISKGRMIFKIKANCFFDEFWKGAKSERCPDAKKRPKLGGRFTKIFACLHLHSLAHSPAWNFPQQHFDWRPPVLLPLNTPGQRAAVWLGPGWAMENGHPQTVIPGVSILTLPLGPREPIPWTCGRVPPAFARWGSDQ